MSQLDGKVAVITGAASGPGLAAVQLFASEGVSVYAAAHPADRLQHSLASVEGDVTAVACDPGLVPRVSRIKLRHGH